ncbi:MAG: acetyl-CoA carboxylase biotin carboxyl carrier protein [Alkalibacterium sp.]
MNNEEIKELIHLIDQSSLTHFEFENASASLKLSKRESGESSQITETAKSAGPVVPSMQESKRQEAETDEVNMNTVDAVNAENEQFHLIKSPIVGTSYRSSSPDSPAFVTVGDTVKKGQTVLIIEAMKVMNEIKSDVQGTVVDILVEDGQAIEFDQILVKIKED